MSTQDQYWMSEHQGNPKEIGKIFNELFICLKLENIEEGTVSKLLVLFLLTSGYRLTDLLDL